MPANPHRRAVEIARQTARELAKLFAQYLGSQKHPRGAVLAAYRMTRRALRDAYRTGAVAAEFLDILLGLERLLGESIRGAMIAAVLLGRRAAQRQLRAYELAGYPFEAAEETPNYLELAGGWLGTLEGQLKPARALVLTGADEAWLLGDDTRLGLLQPAPVQTGGSYWLAYAVSLAFWLWVVGPDRTAKPVPFQRQAIAVIDDRTTDCCLQVHGQIVDVGEKFRLTGTPRYADYLDSPPFHRWCRTSEALYLAEQDNGLTPQLLATAQRTNG